MTTENAITKTIVPEVVATAPATLTSMEFSGPYHYLADGSVHCMWKGTLPYHIHADHTSEAWEVLQAAIAAGEITVQPYVEPVVSAAAAALLQIQDLDRQITKRRLREAMLTDAGKAWLVDIEAKITALRASL